MNVLSVINVTYVGNLSVKIEFSDGVVRVVNIGDFIHRHPHPQYNKYLNEKKMRCFSMENGNVVWGKNWDLIFPIEQLYKGTLS